MPTAHPTSIPLVTGLSRPCALFATTAPGPTPSSLLIISDAYGLVEPDSPAGWPVPIPFTRTENPDWWAGFISRNLDNYITRRIPASAFVLFEPAHEPALRASRKLRDLDPTWTDAGASGLDALTPWVTGEPAPATARLRSAPPAAPPLSRPSPADQARRDTPLSAAQMLAAPHRGRLHLLRPLHPGHQQNER